MENSYKSVESVGSIMDRMVIYSTPGPVDNNTRTQPSVNYGSTGSPLFSALTFDFFVFEFPTLFGIHRALRLVVEG